LDATTWLFQVVVIKLKATCRRSKLGKNDFDVVKQIHTPQLSRFF
jgi:hypothetical protein